MDLLGGIISFMNEPIPSFFFEVLILDDPFDADNPMAMMSATASLAVQALDPTACAFTEVSGLEIVLNTNDYPEGGWSTPRPQFKDISTSTLTLKRYLRPRHVGIMGFSFDPISGWCQDTVQAAKKWEKKIKPKDMMIFVYHPMIQNPLPVGPASFPIAGFLVQEAFPVKWGISDLSSTEEAQPIVETIDFKYTELQRLAIPPA
jgi:hypothetical protein